MKRIVIVGLLISFILALPFANKVLKAESQNAMIDSILCTNGLNPNYLPMAMMDNDVSTVWRSSNISPQETGLVISLAQPVKLVALKLHFTEIRFDEIEIEYYQNSGWHTFTGQTGIKPSKVNQWVSFDLSYDQVTTDKIRIHIYNKNKSSYIGSIAELKVFGYPDTFRKNLPITAIKTSSSQELYKVSNLCDGNTHSAWETIADSTGKAQVELEFPHAKLSHVKFFMKSDLKGNLAVEYSNGGDWKLLPGCESLSGFQLITGWNVFPANEVITNKIRLTLINPVIGRLGNINEVQVWGKAVDIPDKQYYDSGLHRLQFGKDLKETTVRVDIPHVNISSRYSLVLVTDGQMPNQLELNGIKLQHQPAFYRQNPVTCYRISIEQSLIKNDNYLKIISDNTIMLYEARIEEVKDTGALNPVHRNPGNLNDGWCFIPGNENSVFDVDYKSRAHVEWVKLFADTSLNYVRVQVDNGYGWQDIYTVQTQYEAFLHIDIPNGVTTQRVRYLLRHKAALNEILSWGSWVNGEQPPRLTQIIPVDEQIVPVGQSTIEVSGVIDQLEAVVRINGEPATLNGEHFSKILSLNQGPVRDINIEAQTQQNGVTVERRRIFISEKPEFTLDQNESEYFVKAKTFIISGTGNAYCDRISINNNQVRLANGRFSYTYPLVEGRNVLDITAYDKKGVYTLKQIIVFCDNNAPWLIVKTPLLKETAGSSAVEVSGCVADLTPVKVDVNGIESQLNGSAFIARINLAVGTNTIRVTAVDKLGNSKIIDLNVEHFPLQPKLSVIYPTANQIIKTGQFTLQGTVIDTQSVKVKVNGELVNVINQSFQSLMNFPEGWHPIKVYAFNSWGYESMVNLKVLVDETRPMDFEVLVEPSGWTNNNQPTITFNTIDKVSGIDHYELKIDDQEYQVVESPYQCPPLGDGEHRVTVKAVDRAGWETLGNTTLYIDTTAPEKVKDFKAVPGFKKIILNWSLNPETDIDRYVVSRAPSFADGKVKEFGPGVKEFVDNEVTHLQGYTYTIWAVDRAENQSPANTHSTVKAGLAEVVVDPKTETKIEFDNVVIGVPEGALPDTKTVTVMQVQNADDLLNKSLAVNVTPVYSLSTKTKDGLVDPNGVEFKKPVMVGIKFTLTDLYEYLNKGNLRAYYYDNAAGNWEMIPESFVDGENNVVYFFTKHFSMFSVQASVASPMAPEQISGMGISPGKAYFQNNQVGVSYGSGSANVTAKDFVLPGKGGLDLTISRTYDSQVGQADWGLEEKNLFSTMFGFISANRWLTLAKNLIGRQLDKYLAKPAGSFGFGRGWRMNFVWVEKDENGQFLHLPGGGMKKIHWKMDGPGWDGQGHGVFECHAGEHFILEQTQRKVGDVFTTDETEAVPVKVGENWEATSYTLTTKDGTRYYMDGNGLIQRIVNRLGTSEIKFFYEGKQLDYIIDSVGRRIEITYTGKFIQSISAAGKTVTYHYNDKQELELVNDGGLQETKYGYQLYTLTFGSQTVSLVDIITCFFNPEAWVNLLGALVPNEQKTDVYYLSSVETPFKGEYKFNYKKKKVVRYGDFGSGLSLSFGVMWFDFAKVDRFEENGSAFNKVQTIEYNIAYDEDAAPIVQSCNIYEGNRRTYMMFDRISNSVEQDVPLLKIQMVYGEQDRLLTSHLVEYDTELEAPIRVTDNTGGRSTIQEYKYDNWGNVVWQKNHHTKVEAFYAYANTEVSGITYPQAMSSPYSGQTLADTIHDAKTGEYILNYNGEKVIPQQTYYNYASNGNLLEKAIRSGGKWLKTGYQYDDVGNIITMTSPTGIETYYEYSADYQKALLTKVTLGKLTDPDGKVQTNVILKELGYEPLTYRKRWEKDARGFVTEYQHDILGREVMTVLPDDTDRPEFKPTVLSGAINRSGERSDNPAQQVIFEDGNRTTKVIDPMGNRTDYIYDAFEHLIEIVKYTKVLGVHIPYSRVKVGYDDQGNIASIISPLGCKNPDDTHKYSTKYLYDELNRLSRIIYPDDTVTDADNPYKAYAYNEVNNTVTVYEGANAEDTHQTLITKDAVDRVIEQVAGYRSDAATTSKFDYDALGNKTSETDGRGNTTLFVYDDQNRLVQKTLPETIVLNNPGGAVQSKRSEIKYQYDDEGNLVQEISPLGRVVYHDYDEMNREIKTRTVMTGRDGAKKTLISKVYYDLAGNKAKTVDPNGKAVENTYSARGWLLSTKNPMGGIITYTYDLIGNKLSETDPRGNAAGAVKNSYTAWYFYDDLYRVVRAVLPDKTPPADPNHPGDNPVINFTYDENGNCIEETKANGQEIHYTYNGRNWLLTQTQSLNGKSYTTRFEYDWIGNKRFVYDNKNNPTEFRYDALNRPTIQIFPEGNTISYEYDLSGNKRIVRDGKLNETEYIYDETNRLIQSIDAEKKSSYSYYNEEGQLTKSVSATGLVTMFYLNELGLPLEVVDSLNQKRSFDYDLAGNVIYKKDSRGTETSFQYDDLYRLLRTELKNGTRTQYLSYDYDMVGNIRRANNGQVELVYNDGGEFDPFNRIEKVEQIMSGGTRYITEYRYDQLTGAMTGIRYPNSSAWLDYEYDQMGRLTAIPGFAGTKEKPGFTYDENNAVESVITDNGIITTYLRDKNGRVTNINAGKTGSEAVLTLGYAYDAANNIIQRNDNSYIYDKVYRLQQATIRGVFEDKFTKADMLMGTVDQDYKGEKGVEEDITNQTEIKLDYAARSLILNLQTDAENISRVELVPSLKSHRVPADQLEIYVRNGVGFTKLEKNQWTGVKDANGKITITFTPLLNAKEIKIHCNYDDLDLLQMPVDRSEFFNTPEQMVTVYQKLTTRTETYEYGAMGNRMVEKLLLRKEYVYNYEYYPNSNRLKNNGRYAYEFDANGNLVKKTSIDGKDIWEYSYDLFNQLEQVKKNGEVVSSYVYDPNGFRVQKTGTKGVTHYVQLLNGEVGYKKELSSGKEYSFIYVGIQHLARVNGVIGGSGKKFYYQNDHLGSAMAITDENGDKVVERDFTPFGEKIDLIEPMMANPDETEDGFTGKDWDEDIGLYYYNARWYDPTIGKFIAEDSVMDDPNLYSYCGQNPVNAIDPTGNSGIQFSLKAGTLNLIAQNVDGAGAILGAAGCFNAFISKISKNPLVFVHGWHDNWTRWTSFIERITGKLQIGDKSLGELAVEFRDDKTPPERKAEILKMVQLTLKRYNLYIFDYTAKNNQNPETIGEDFAKFMSDNKLGSKTNIVAHSMGNLVVADSIIHHGVKINNWAMIAPPNQGSDIRPIGKASIRGILGPIVGEGVIQGANKLDPAQKYMDPKTGGVTKLYSRQNLAKLENGVRGDIMIFAGQKDYAASPNRVRIPHYDTRIKLYSVGTGKGEVPMEEGIKGKLAGQHNMLAENYYVQKDVLNFLYGD